MNEDAKKIIDRMTPQHQKQRLRELNARLGITDPQNNWAARIPPANDFSDVEEREYLKQKLGYSISREPPPRQN